MELFKITINYSLILQIITINVNYTALHIVFANIYVMLYYANHKCDINSVIVYLRLIILLILHF